MENEDRIQHIEKMVAENNRILNKMQSHQHWGWIFKAIYWIIILVSLYSSYVYLSPIISTITDNFGEIQKTIGGLGSR